MYIFNKDILRKEEFLTLEQTERVYKDCKFSNFEFEGGDIDAIFIDCIFENIKSYLSLFNVCTFVNVRFDNCEFEGNSFMGSTFLKCTFINCVLKDDNIGGHTTFENCDLLLSKFENCKMGSVKFINSKVINE